MSASSRLWWLTLLGGLWFAQVAFAQTVWCGPSITFQQVAAQESPTAQVPVPPDRADHLTSQVALNRRFQQGLYNSRQESEYTSTSPAGTEWAFGTAANYRNLSFQTWRLAVNENPPSMVGQNMVVHLIAENIYLNVRFTAWAGAPGSGSRFTYIRSTPGSCASTVPVPGWTLVAAALLLLLVGATISRGVVPKSALACILCLLAGACSSTSENSSQRDEATPAKRADKGTSAKDSGTESADDSSSTDAADPAHDTDDEMEQRRAEVQRCEVDNGGCGDPKFNECRAAKEGAIECLALDPCKADNGGCGDAKYNACQGEKGRAATCSDIDECARDNGGCGDDRVYSCENKRGAAPTCHRRWQTAALGVDHVCAVAKDGELFCWGGNDLGQLGVNDFEQRALPQRVGSDASWSQLSAGAAVSCGILSAKLYCWGDNYYQQLGAPATNLEKNVSPAPAQVGAEDGWQDIAVGEAHVCGIRQSRLYCWGVNDLGQIGDGTEDDRSSPSQIGDLDGWVAVASGSTSTCAIRAGELHCWGDNSAGQLGDASDTSHNVPTRVGTASDWSQIAVGGDTACGIRAGELHCWGDNTSGKLGTDTQAPNREPMRVGSARDWTSIAVGQRKACGTRGGELHCWGDNAQGSRLGVDSTETQVRAPARVGTMKDWTSVAGIGADFYCAMRSEDSLYCWGNNQSGQLGDGTANVLDEPTRVSSVSSSRPGE